MNDVIDTVVDRIVTSVDPDKVILFGSRSKGHENPDSDYDILVLKNETTNRRAMTHKLYKDLADISAAIDIIVATQDIIERHRHITGNIYSEAIKGRIVYERPVMQPMVTKGKK